MDRAQRIARERVRPHRPTHNFGEERPPSDYEPSRGHVLEQTPPPAPAELPRVVDVAPVVPAYCNCPPGWRVTPAQLGRSCWTCGAPLHLRGRGVTNDELRGRAEVQAFREFLNKHRDEAGEIPLEKVGELHDEWRRISGTAETTPSAPPEKAPAPKLETVGDDWKTSGLSSKWAGRTFRERPTAYVDQAAGGAVTEDGTPVTLRKGASLGALLAALPEGIARVYLLNLPGGTPAKFARWHANVPDGWSDGGHYLAAVERFVLVYVRDDGRRVELHRAATWIGDTPCNPAQMRAAMAATRDALRSKFGDGVQLLTTPAATGRVLWRQSIKFGVEWDVLTDEHQDLIRATSGQGRVQSPLELGAAGDVADVVRLDGRLMYGALCRELGTGPAVHDDVPEFAGYHPGRYRVRFTIPAGWAHVGILGVRDGSRWEYPNDAGGVYETWADGAELIVATKHGWTFDVLERLLFTKSSGDGPLGGWARKIADAREAITHPDPVVVDAARSAMRSVLLFALGAFWSRPRLVTRSVHIDDAETVTPPASIIPHVDGELIVWSEKEAAKWPELAHPEWLVAVWARCRARLLDGPGGTGMLNLPAGHVLGVETDALYLTHDPGWPDDGKPGRFRMKGAGGPASVATLNDLHEAIR